MAVMSKNIVKVLLILFWLTEIVATAKFSNINCTNYDPSYSKFEYCYIKAINRTYQYISVRLKLLKVPVDKVTLNFALTKRANGYKPFLYNFTYDACKFLKHRTNPVFNFFYKATEEFSNLNHTCPYSHDIWIEKLAASRVNYLFTNLLPMPRGDYGVHSTIWTHNVLRVKLNTFITLS